MRNKVRNIEDGAWRKPKRRYTRKDWEVRRDEEAVLGDEFCSSQACHVGIT